MIALWPDLAPEHEPTSREAKIAEAIEAVRVALGLSGPDEADDLKMALVCLETAQPGGEGA